MSERLDIPRDWVACRCPCGNEFQVPPSMRGGLTNCPACRALVEVRAGFELLWALTLAGAVVAVVVLPALLWISGSRRAAAIFLGLGVTVLFGLWAHA